MSYDYSQAEDQRDYSDLIPNGTLAWGILSIRPGNADPQYFQAVTHSKSSDAVYLDCAVTIVGGDHDKRKVFTKIGIAGKETYANMGRSQIKAILEVGKRAGPQNPDGYKVPQLGDGSPDFMQLDGLQVAIKVKEEPGTQQYPNPRNEVAVWLSPISPATQKDFARLVAGDTKPAVTAARPAAQAQQAQQPAWGQQTAAAPQQAPAWGPQGTAAPQTQQAAPAATPQQQSLPGQPAGGAPSWLQQ